MQAIAIFGVLVFIMMGVGMSGYTVFGVNITNISVIAKVNVTNTEPNITSVIVDDDEGNPASEIDLTANGVTRVTCNATIFDYNGNQDINPNKTNATLYIRGINTLDPDDNNHKYTNSSCGVCETLTATSSRCSCTFALNYYTNYSSNWICNFSVTDNGGTQIPSRQINLSDNQASDTVTVTRLLAINTTQILDYGNLTVTETSEEIVHNVSNAGNTNLNLTLRGYGGDNETVGENLSMICDFGNISIGYQRFSVGSENLGATSYSTMTVLRNMTQNTSLALPQRINDADYGSDRNSTFWRLQVPLSVGGLCNGTIIFGAIETE